jgi:hypothetical protein
MNKYQELLQNPPRVRSSIKKNAKEVIFYVVSCMCDNKHTLKFRKNDDGEFKMSGMGQALSNFQFGYKEGGIKPFEIEWEADNRNWTDVIEMINSGTSKIEKVISR